MASSTSLVTGIDFAAIFVTDFDAAADFYGGTLGLPCSSRYERMPGGEFETGNLTLQVLDAAAIGREFKPSWSRRASSSAPTRWTPASATWPSSPTPTATR